jgi:sulfur-oxidizing protein SoxZ
MADIGSPRVRTPGKPVAKGSLAEIKTLIKHPMESGLRKDKETGEIIPAHFVSEVVAEYLDKEVMRAEWSGAISKNPFFSFHIKAETTGKVKVTWKDNKGETFSASGELTVA